MDETEDSPQAIDDIHQQPNYHDSLYEMTVGSYLMFRFTQTMCFIAGLFVAALSVYAVFQLLTTRQPGVWLAICGAIAGALIMVIAVRARDTVVIAQPDGLRKRWLLGDTLIPWNEIASLTRRSTWLTVRAQTTRRRISWPVLPFDSARRPQEHGAALLNPHEMAALVEQRTGLTIQNSNERSSL